MRDGRFGRANSIPRFNNGALSMSGFILRIPALATFIASLPTTVSSALSSSQPRSLLTIPARLITALLLTLYIGSEAHAQTATSSTITVEQPWARATPKGASTGAAYMTLINNSTTADRLLGATTSMAEAVQFHKETQDNGVSRMRQVPAVDLEPGAKIIFKPGEMHMMIVRLKQPLTEGQTLPLTLQFEKAGAIEVTVPIGKVGAMEPNHMDHGGMGSMTH
jgi:copper(I)-binding protein